ncbi:TNT domain-containing protein [Mycobacterium riyadhense]|uniref:TNT domain-containing protein n=1 Tax=Mycobacterium riyadhense TaxID=486698 RepID=UPI00201128E7|nr:TNT domain-containing protein [Mycobacterium riyadhense]
MLTPGDVKRWDLGAIQMVFETASGRAATLQRLGDGLDQAHRVLAEWQGEAGEAFRADVGRIRRDIEADGVESQRVAAAVSRAEADVSACKRELEDVERAAAVNGWTITSDWRIEVGDAWIGRDPIGLAAEQQVLQDELTACKVHAHAADHELATAIGAAVGEVSLDGVGVSPGGVVPRQGVPDVSGGRPRTWQEMLLPGGPAEAGPGGVPAEGPLVSAGGGGEPPSLRDLLLPTERTQPTGAGGQEPAPGSVPDLLSRVHQPVVSGVRPPRPSAAEVERFKALVRPTMIADGVAPGQVEARLNEIVARAQRWIDEGMPNYVVPEPPRPPAPGFGEGFGDRWRATEQGIKNLFGQGGPGAPGVLESWQRMLEGTVETVQNPIGSAIGEVKDALDSPSPAYFLGAKVSDAATTLPGLFFGGEGAAIRTGLPAETVTEGGAPLAIVRGWEPTGGMAWDDFASQFGTPQARNYPLDDGFPPGFVPQPAQLPEGAIIDRFGSEYGRYLAPDGTPFADRALAPESVGGAYNRYMVTGKPLPPGWQIVEGPVQPYYGQTPSPRTLQYMIVGPDGVKPTVWELVRLGILDEYGPRLGR